MIYKEHFGNLQVLCKYLWLLLCNYRCVIAQVHRGLPISTKYHLFYYLKLSIAKNEIVFPFTSEPPTNFLIFQYALLSQTSVYKDIFSFSSPFPSQYQIQLFFPTSYANLEIIFHISYSRSFIKILSWESHTLHQKENFSTSVNYKLASIYRDP